MLIQDDGFDGMDLTVGRAAIAGVLLEEWKPRFSLPKRAPVFSLRAVRAVPQFSTESDELLQDNFRTTGKELQEPPPVASAQRT